MTRPHAAMSAPAASATPSGRRQLDEALVTLRDRAAEFARTPAMTKAALVRECIGRLEDCAPAWVAHGCRAKRLGPGEAGEEWLVGPLPTVRMARLLAGSLEAIAAGGRPPLGRRVRERPDGRLAVDAFPSSGIDRALFGGVSGYALLREGTDRDAAVRLQATFYQHGAPEGGVSLVLGAGNVSSIPAMDVLTKMFVDGSVCVLKMNPVNEWVGPHLERGLAPLIARGYLRIVYGGGDAGAYLVAHDSVDDVHITGSNLTHDHIVWGPPGPERERRIAAGEPVLSKPITSELGNVSPVAIVPHDYADDELEFQARNVVTMVTNNASFNCNAAKVLVTARGWPQRERFLGMVADKLARVPPRAAYYPGAFDRYRELVGDRGEAEACGAAGDGELPWTLLRDVDPDRRDEPLFRVEPFCGILTETPLPESDVPAFLDAATTFMNDRLWGTLSASIIVHPRLEADPTVAEALDRAIVRLRYGTVAINHWTAIGYVSCTLPWGGHGSVSLDDVQSGVGWVHNTYMLGGVDKSVIRGPLKVWPTPAWFHDHPKSHLLGPRMVRMEAEPGWLKLPGLIARAL